MKPLRVLLITRECLRSDSNEGNTLLNLFEGLPVKVSNIYCKPCLPNNDICKDYFQLTDKMALRALLRGMPMGCRVKADINAFIRCHLFLGLIQYRMVEASASTVYVSANRVERAKEARAKT